MHHLTPASRALVPHGRWRGLSSVAMSAHPRDPGLLPGQAFILTDDEDCAMTACEGFEKLSLKAGTRLEYVECQVGTYADGNMTAPGEFWAYLHSHRLRVLDGLHEGRCVQVLLLNDEPWPEWLARA